MIKVLVVDDSRLMRRLLKDILTSDPEFEVVGTAENGIQAIEKIQELKPKVVLMDVEMPELDGIGALTKIMETNPLPVVMLTAKSEKGSDASVEAMQLGAVDFIFKPKDQVILQLKQEIIDRVKTASKANVRKKIEVQHATISSGLATRKKIVVIGSSTGGPQTLEAVLTGIPKDFPAPILIVQHMPPLFTKSLAERLNNICEIEVREAKEGDEIKNGLALIAPGDFHMKLISNIEGFEGTIHLNQEPRELGVRPCVNKLFESVAPIFKENTIGVVLTGMGRDGADGCKIIKQYKGTVIAESEESAIIYGMPRAVVDEGWADEVINVANIPVALAQLVEI